MWKSGINEISHDVRILLRDGKGPSKASTDSTMEGSRDRPVAVE